MIELLDEVFFTLLKPLRIIPSSLLEHTYPKEDLRSTLELKRLFLLTEKREYKGGGVQRKKKKTRSPFLLRSLFFPFIVAEQLYASCCDVQTNDYYWLRTGGDLQVQGCWYWMSRVDKM